MSIEQQPCSVLLVHTAADTAFAKTPRVLWAAAAQDSLLLFLQLATALAAGIAGAAAAIAGTCAVVGQLEQSAPNPAAAALPAASPLAGTHYWGQP